MLTAAAPACMKEDASEQNNGRHSFIYATNLSHQTDMLVYNKNKDLLQGTVFWRDISTAIFRYSACKMLHNRKIASEPLLPFSSKA